MPAGHASKYALACPCHGGHRSWARCAAGWGRRGVVGRGCLWL